MEFPQGLVTNAAVEFDHYAQRRISSCSPRISRENANNCTLRVTILDERTSNFVLSKSGVHASASAGGALYFFGLRPTKLSMSPGK
jgi:hypothetical protein